MPSDHPVQASSNQSTILATSFRLRDLPSEIQLIIVYFMVAPQSWHAEVVRHWVKKDIDSRLLFSAGYKLLPRDLGSLTPTLVDKRMRKESNAIIFKNFSGTLLVDDIDLPWALADIVRPRQADWQELFNRVEKFKYCLPLPRGNSDIRNVARFLPMLPNLRQVKLHFPDHGDGKYYGERSEDFSLEAAFKGDFDAELHKLLSFRSTDEEDYDLSFTSVERLWSSDIGVVAESYVWEDGNWLVSFTTGDGGMCTNKASSSAPQ